MTATEGLRESFSVFRLRNYRLFWFGGLTSNIGRWFQTLAIPLVVFDLTDSAGWVGFAGFAQILPMALMGPYGGAIADRYPRRKVLLVTQTLQAFVALGLMTLWFSGVRSPGAYVAVSALVGMTAGLNLPAWQAIVSEIVPREQLLAGITLNSAQFNASRMIGPALGGAAIAWFGPGWAFFVNAISYSAVLTGLALMRLDIVHRRPEGRMRPLHEFAGAARYAFRSEGIRTAILTVSMIGFSDCRSRRSRSPLPRMSSTRVSGGLACSCRSSDSAPCRCRRSSPAPPSGFDDLSFNRRHWCSTPWGRS